MFPILIWSIYEHLSQNLNHKQVAVAKFLDDPPLHDITLGSLYADRLTGYGVHDSVLNLRSSPSGGHILL